MNSTVRAEGPGAIAVGGDAINSIFITGGVNQFFVGQYERLAEAYLNPKALYRELRLDRFTGRGWLLRAIDDFLAVNDRGYIVVEAEAGMGKTAFIAWVARERRYVHHFVRLMSDPNDIGVALRSLSAQLIRAWDLQAMAVGGMLPSNASRPDFFEDVLFEAAAKRDATRPGEPIVIAIDGLNETTAAPIQNPLALPEDLPRGVYIVVSQRTVHVPLAMVTLRRVLKIRAQSPENLADIRSFLDAAVTEADLRERIVAAGVAPESWCFEQSGFGVILAHGGGGVGDSGYQGCGLVSPIKKRAGIDRSEHDIEFNTGLAKVRVGAEWGFAHLKNWRILASRYRGDLCRIDPVVQAVTGLQILNERFSERRLTFRQGLIARVSE